MEGDTSGPNESGICETHRLAWSLRGDSWLGPDGEETAGEEGHTEIGSPPPAPPPPGAFLASRQEVQPAGLRDVALHVLSSSQDTEGTS